MAILKVANSEPPVSVTVTQDDQEETSINKNPDTPVILPSADPDSTTNNSKPATILAFTV